jgi:hypothetical protein
MKLLEKTARCTVMKSPKVKAITLVSLTLPKALCILLHKLEAEGILDVEMEKVDNHA